MCLKIRCDGECEKFCKIFWEVNKAQDCSETLSGPKHSRGDHWPGRMICNATSGGQADKRRAADKPNEALFSLWKILDFATLALSFVYGKYYPIID